MTAVLHPIMHKAAKQSAAAPTELRPGCGGALSFPIYLPQVFLLKQSVRAEHLGTNAERCPQLSVPSTTTPESSLCLPS